MHLKFDLSTFEENSKLLIKYTGNLTKALCKLHGLFILARILLYIFGDWLLTQHANRANCANVVNYHSKRKYEYKTSVNT